MPLYWTVKQPKKRGAHTTRHARPAPVMNYLPPRKIWQALVNVLANLFVFLRRCNATLAAQFNRACLIYRIATQIAIRLNSSLRIIGKHCARIFHRARPEIFPIKRPQFSRLHYIEVWQFSCHNAPNIALLMFWCQARNSETFSCVSTTR